MKKLYLILCCIFTIFITGCDNNEGPFEKKRENGIIVLYSNNKPAKGWVEEKITDFNTGISVKKSEIEYNKGLPTGKFKFYNINGVLILDANLKKDGELYKGNIVISDEAKMEGTFSINSDWIVEADILFFNFEQIAVDAKIKSKNLEAEYKNKKEHGEWRLFLEGKIFKKVTYENGELNGSAEDYDSSGNLMYKGSYINGKKEGIWEGENYHAEYKDDKLNGYYEAFGEKGNYLEDKKEGLWEKRNYKNQIILRETYKEGILNGLYEKYTNDNGILLEKGETINGRREGIWYFYDKNGKLEVEAEFENGRIAGFWKEYYENGNLKLESNDGRYATYYEEDGTAIEDIYFGKYQFETAGIDISKVKSFEYRYGLTEFPPRSWLE